MAEPPYNCTLKHPLPFPFPPPPSRSSRPFGQPTIRRNQHVISDRRNGYISIHARLWATREKKLRHTFPSLCVELRNKFLIKREIKRTELASVRHEVNRAAHLIFFRTLRDSASIDSDIGCINIYSDNNKMWNNVPREIQILANSLTSLYILNSRRINQTSLPTNIYVYFLKVLYYYYASELFLLLWGKIRRKYGKYIEVEYIKAAFSANERTIVCFLLKYKNSFLFIQLILTRSIWVGFVSSFNFCRGEISCNFLKFANVDK